LTSNTKGFGGKTR